VVDGVEARLDEVAAQLRTFAEPGAARAVDARLGLGG
jgi:hypothetical protein